MSMNTATRDADELTATGLGGTFDIRPYWYDDDGDMHSYPMFRDWVADRTARGYAVYERKQQSSPDDPKWVHDPVGDFMDVWHATIEAERLAAGD